MQLARDGADQGVQLDEGLQLAGMVSVALRMACSMTCRRCSMAPKR